MSEVNKASPFRQPERNENTAAEDLSTLLQTDEEVRVLRT